MNHHKKYREKVWEKIETEDLLKRAFDKTCKEFFTEDVIKEILENYKTEKDDYQIAKEIIKYTDKFRKRKYNKRK